MHVHVFPGTISAWKMFPKEVPADASPRLAAEKGANEFFHRYLLVIYY